MYKLEEIQIEKLAWTLITYIPPPPTCTPTLVWGDFSPKTQIFPTPFDLNISKNRKVGGVVSLIWLFWFLTWRGVKLIISIFI